MELRDYQSQAVASVFRWFETREGNPLVVAPTGAGKSVILAEFIRQACLQYAGTRILVVTHVKELIRQNHAQILRLWPQAPAGIYSAGLGMRQIGRQIMVAGVQSIAKKTKALGYYDLVIVDEAHLIPRDSATLYGKLFDGMREINPDLKIVGLTATPYRTDSGRLDMGKGAMFDGIAYDIPVAMLVQRGYLAPLISKRPGMVFDLSGIKTRMGDWAENDMDARFNTDDITRQAVAEVMTLGAARKAWLVFCISVDHATAVRDELRAHGVTAETVTGKTPAIERDRLLRDYKAGRIKALTSVGVLTTGFDAPLIDLLVFLRPTQSTGLYIQMAGRAMRTCDGKENALVLDFAGNVARHGPVDAIQMPGEKVKGEKGGDAPTKCCPQCQSILLIAARECPDCGFEFPEPEKKIERTASTDAIMNLTAHDDWREVRDFDLLRHKKEGQPDSMRVEYLIGRDVVKEWVCFGHTGYARKQAVAWWQTMAGTSCPANTDEALTRLAEVRRPVEAVTIREGKYTRVKRIRFERLERTAAE